MAMSPIEICNAALTLLGDNVIASFEESSTPARLCAAQWPLCRNAVLRMHPWNCAIRRQVLAPVAAAPVSEYSAAFNMPGDLVRLLSIDGLREDYCIEGRQILCNQSSITIRFVYRNEDVSTYDALLTEVLSYYLAAKLAYPITKSNTTAESMLALFKTIMPAAKNIDAQEEPMQQFGESSFITVRG